LLIADNKQDVSLNVFTSSSFDKINEFEKKKSHLDNLSAVKLDFDKLKLLNDKFISQESILGKLKNTFIRSFGKIEKDLSEQTAPDSLLSISIRTLETKINTTLKNERDNLISDRATLVAQRTNAENANKDFLQQLQELIDYEPADDHLLYQGLLTKAADQEKQKTGLEAQITQLERSQFSLQEVEKSIRDLENDIAKKEQAIGQYDNLLYQNMSTDPEIVKKVFNYLSNDVARLDKSKIARAITLADLPMTLFDGQIDTSSINLVLPPSIKELQEEVSTKNKELSEKKIQLDTLNNRDTLQGKIDLLKKDILSLDTLLTKIRNKPALLQKKADNELLINVTLRKAISEATINIDEKDSQIEKEKKVLELKKHEKDRYETELKKYKSQYQEITGRTDIYEIEEIVDEPFEQLYEKFHGIYESFRITKDNRKDLKDSINIRLKKDIQDIKHFIREVEEEIANIPQMDKVISNLLDTLSFEIGSPTFTFLTQFNDFKSFVYKSYNGKLAEYPVSNIQQVKVKIHENEDLIKDLDKVSKLKFSNGLDFDNAYLDGKRALERQLAENKGKPIEIYELFTIKVEITKVTGETEEIDLSKQVQSRGTNIVLKLYLFLNI
jgi:chromosome segregation ATPase